jgi:RNA polymerase sigma factor (sigma-70 family)
MYRALAPSVLGYLRGQGAADAEGLTSDVFVAVVTRLPRFVGDADALKAWVFTIAHHRLVDARRRGARRPDASATDAALESASPIMLDGEVEIDIRLAAAPALEALDRLSPDQRDTILLRVIADLSVERTAEILGKPPGAVKALQRRALAALRRELAGEAVS